MDVIVFGFILMFSVLALAGLVEAVQKMLKRRQTK